MKVLELFAGEGSIRKASKELGFEVFSIDWVNNEGIDLVKDIQFLEIPDIPFIPDVIWASPDCTTYSVAALHKHRNRTKPKTEYAIKCDKVNTHFIEVIKQFIEINPKLIFYIENPRGMFRKMPFVRTFLRRTVWYCKYGDTRAKPTDIFTNNYHWKPKPECKKNNIHCHHEKSPRGANTGTQKLSKKNRSKIPHELCLEVLYSAYKQINL
jgi:site-specific DNA-cytosine methylase